MLSVLLIVKSSGLLLDLAYSLGLDITEYIAFSKSLFSGLLDT